MKSLVILLLCCFITSFSAAQKLVANNKQLFKIHVGIFQFPDRFELVDKIRGYNVGLTYERFFLQHWSLSFGLEYCTNDNAIGVLKKTLQTFKTFNLPEKEQRFTFSTEPRYYIKKGGSGFYLGNALAIQRLRNEVGVSSCPSLPTICMPNFVYNTSAIADRLSVGYQTLIAKKALIGLSIGYEFRLIAFYELVRSPQIAVHFGFAK